MSTTKQMIHLRVGQRALSMLDVVVKATGSNRALAMRCALDLARAHRDEWEARIKATVEADLASRYDTVTPIPEPPADTAPQSISTADYGDF